MSENLRQAAAREGPERVTLLRTVGNTARKAGALNWALRWLFEHQPAANYVFCMDDDTVLAPDVIEEGLRVLKRTEDVGAVASRAGVLPAPPRGRIVERVLWRLQKHEYAAFDAHRVEMGDRIKVIAGMAALYRVEALRDVAAYRQLRGQQGLVYREDSLVEDYELTCILKTLGWKATFSLAMDAWTEVPTTLQALWRQRIRWMRGFVDTIREFGVTPATKWEYFGQGYLFTLLALQLVILGLFLSSAGRGMLWDINIWFVGLLLLSFGNMLYRLHYVEDLTLSDVMFKLAVVPEMVYDWFKLIVLIYSYALSFTDARKHW